jgi:hypothetical protein
MDRKSLINQHQSSVIEKMTQFDRESTKVDFDKQALSPDTEE